MTLTCMRWAVALVPILVAARPSLRRDWPALRARWLLSRGHGRARLHRLRRALLCRRAPHQRAQPLDHPGRDPGARPARRPLFLGLKFTGAAGARRLRHHARRRRDRRSGRSGPAHGARLQHRRRHDGGRGRSLRRLYDRPSPAAAGLGPQHAGRHGVRRLRHLGPADDLGDRLGRLRLADRGRTTARSPMWRSVRRSRRRCFSCAGSS